MPAGRPPFYETVEELQKGIDDYFSSLDGEQPAVTGLALHLGFTSRQALTNYEEKPEFVDPIKKAKLKVELAYEKSLHGRNAAGPIFALKNFGWKDTQEIKHDLPTGFLNIDPLSDDPANNSAQKDSGA